MEETPTIETPPPSETPVETAEKKQFMRTAFRWILIVFALLLLGGGLVYMLLYWPAHQQTLQLQAQVNQLSSDLEAAKKQAADAQNRLESMGKNMAQTQAMLNSANAHIAISALKSDLSLARIAIMEKDWPTAAEAFSLARKDLERLPAAAAQGDVLTGLQKRLDEAHKTYISDAEKALPLLKDLFSNLTLVESAIK